MKTVPPLFFLGLILSCTHVFAGQPTRKIISAPIELAQKNYTNGLVSEAFTVLLRAYEETHDLKCLEYATGLSDREIQRMKNKSQNKAEELKDTKHSLEVFWQQNPDMSLEKNRIKIGNDAYDVLRSDSIEIFSKEIFIPRTELVKNKMMAVQSFVSADITNPNNKESDRLIELQKRINNQRESLCKLRTEYISEVFIGPRVNLGHKLVFLAKLINLMPDRLLRV